MSTRGEHLLRADRGFATGGSALAWWISPAFDRLINELAKRIERGGLEASLPDGTRHRLGFRAPGPNAAVHISSWMALVRLATSGSVGWYKAWTQNEWSSPDPVALFELFAANALSLGNMGRAKGVFRWVNALAHRLRDNAPRNARANIAAHYDLGNDFYSAWLDETMTYSSARFVSPEDSLADAQRHKRALLLDRLDLKPGHGRPEIGCGWGSLAIAAARRGAPVVGLTLSKEQKAWADQKVARAGLADAIEIRLQDYRDTAERFDAVASVEMVEAVGQRWWGAYLGSIARNLRTGGRAALQFISIDHRLFDAYARSPDFIQAYIFPGGILLDEPRFETIAHEHGLTWERREAFGLDYAETLKRWLGRYDLAVARGEIDGFGESFHNLWRYYLMYCEGGFRGGVIDVAQVTLVRRG